ncbi:hypothetical protein GIB67_005588 [Kingdonia uniflora]|uniref:Uncharacterized protein n=1 Tax=Kingdonia uniflora TaxID=39325 RepID=A0A7J7MMD9_9MAGN|nr:hypothetical protein GIB67_005588 [Kingdonia uniflora]
MDPAPPLAAPESQETTPPSEIPPVTLTFKSSNASDHDLSVQCLKMMNTLMQTSSPATFKKKNKEKRKDPAPLSARMFKRLHHLWKVKGSK